MHNNEALTTFTIAAALGVCLFALAHLSAHVRHCRLAHWRRYCRAPGALPRQSPGEFGDGLGTIISLSVAIILFEGGLTPEPEGLSNG